MKKLGHRQRPFLLSAALLALSLTVGSSASSAGADKFIWTDEVGTKHVGPSQIPVPLTVSPEAQTFLSKPFPDSLNYTGQPLEQYRAATDAWMKQHEDMARKIYPVAVAREQWRGVWVDIVTPEGGVAKKNRGRVLINFHGGGGIVGAGSIIEAVPVASLGGIKVVSVDYRLQPEHPYPAAVEDGVAVYRELLKKYPAGKIGIYGASAGGQLTAQVVAKILDQGLPRPGAIGVLTAGAGAPFGDSTYVMLPVLGFDMDKPQLPPAQATAPLQGVIDPLRHPYYSEVLKDFPPTLIMSGTRDGALSASVLLHRALWRAGVKAELHVWEAMPHAHWYYMEMPEAREANQVIADYFNRMLAKKSKP